ncbi:hypothetical protein GCM10010446_48830 [Streptomyces enissocaesilis]|uniref:Alpha/beta hydrolase n=1 Tax=Streptomyces enissocaesilis TaxID=332589 RepID=A0ABP6K027_9ACTN
MEPDPLPHAGRPGRAGLDAGGGGRGNANPPPLSTRTEVIPDAAHDVHLDNPRALHAPLTAFLPHATATRTPGPDRA